MPVRTFRLALLVLLAMLAGALPGRPAQGQGTDRVFPEPLSHDDLLRLLAPLELSEGQQAAIAAEHGPYLEAWLELRHGEIARYLEEFPAFGIAWVEDREMIERCIRRRGAILDSMRGLDEMLLAAAHPWLDEAQRAALPRYAARRERARLAIRPSELGWGLPSLAAVDPVAALERADLDDAERRRIDAMLAACEASLTPLFRRAHEALLVAPLAHHDRTIGPRRAFEAKVAALEEQHDLATEEGRRAFETAIAELHHREAPDLFMDDSGGEEIEPARRAILQATRTVRRFFADARAEATGGELAALEARWIARAYGSVGIPSDPLARREEPKELDEEVRAAAVALRTAHAESRGPWIDRLIGAAEDEGFASGGPFDGEGAVADARDALRSHDRRALERWAALVGVDPGPARGSGGGPRILTMSGETATIEIVGADGAQAFVLEAPEIEGGGIIEANVVFEAAVSTDGAAGEGGGMVAFVTALPAGDFAVGGEAGGEAFEVDASGGGRSSSYLPGPIDEAAVARLLTDAEADEFERSAIEATLDLSRSEHEMLERERLAPARAGVAEARRHAKGTAAVEAAWEELREAMAAITALDARFFDEAAAMLDGPRVSRAIERARIARRRAAHAGTTPAGPMTFMAGPVARERDGDLVALLRDVELAPEIAERRDEVIDRHAAALADATVRRWHAGIAAALARDLRLVEARDRHAEGAFIMTMASPDSEPERDVRAAERDLRGLRAAALAELDATLDAEAAAALRDAWHRATLPGVFAGEAALDAEIAGLLRREELTAADRDRLVDAQLAWRRDRAVLARRMIARIETSREAIADVPAFERFEAQRALTRDLESDRFERDNLDERLRAVITTMVPQPR